MKILRKNIKCRVVAAILTIVVSPVFSQDFPVIGAGTGSYMPNHELFSAVLQTHVHDGLVDYKNLQGDVRFQQYISYLQGIDPDSVKPAEQLAYWLNVYNAFMLKYVIEKYPLESVFSTIAYVFKRSTFHKKFVELNGVKYSFNQVEHKIIRPFGEPRIHFALVCAAQSCPPLRPEAYIADRLNEQLDDQARIFLGDERKNVFDFENKKARVSKIFDWFRGDFASNKTDLLIYLSQFLPKQEGEMLKAEAKRYGVGHFSYNWKLNDASPDDPGK